MNLKINLFNIFYSVVIVFNCNQAFSQENKLVNSKSNNTCLNSEPSRLMIDRGLWKEDDTKRTWFSSTYLKPDGKIIIAYSKLPINYLNSNKKFVPINILPSKNTDGDLESVNQICPVTIKRNGSVNIKISANDEISFSNKVTINGISAKISDFIQDTTHAIQHDIIPGVDKIFDFKLSSVKYSYLLKSPIVALTTDLVIEEELKLPQGAKLETDILFGQQSKNGWEGQLSVLSSDNKELGKIYSAICFDANGEHCLAAYQLENNGGVQKLKIVVPQSWINNVSRVYPITIDPLITGSTVTFTGSVIPSCIAPAYESDSILVTIPGQVTITGFFVSGSYTADISGGAQMLHGGMQFSTKCGKTGVYTIALSDPLATLPGTAYLTNADLKSPLTCCIPQSCSSQTLYVSMRISRTFTLGVTTCNILYINHNPITVYPFQVYVEGRTVEAALVSGSWKSTPATICSNKCAITGTVSVKFGVPPYTITHPWTTTTYTVGTPAGCSTGLSSKSISLTIPGCPIYCTPSGTLSVPPPTVIDACGNSVSTGLTAVTLTLIPTPTVSAVPNPVVACSNIPFNVVLNSCIPSSTISWSGNGSSGNSNNITDTIINNTGSVSSTTFVVTASNNGCVSNPVNVIVNTDPKPIANFSFVTDSVIVNQPVIFTDQSTVIGSTINNWLWSVLTNPVSSNQGTIYVFDTTGIYKVCLAIETANGCRDTICNDITVIPVEIVLPNVITIVLPNVITPNGDHVNDVLLIKNLDFYASNNLKIYDRWGKLIYNKDDYANTWNGDKVMDGTYFLILTVMDKTYSGFLHLFRK